MLRAKTMDCHADAGECVEGASRVHRVWRETTEMLDDENVEATGAGICKEPSEPGSSERRGRSGVLVLADERRIGSPCHRRGEAAVAAGKLGSITARTHAGVGGDAHRCGCAHRAPAFARAPREPAVRVAPFVARPRPWPFAALGALSLIASWLGVPFAKR